MPSQARALDVVRHFARAGAMLQPTPRTPPQPSAAAQPQPTQQPHQPHVQPSASPSAAVAAVTQPTGLVPLRVALRDGYGSGSRPAPRICVHIVPGEPQVVVAKDMDSAVNAAMYAAPPLAGLPLATASSSSTGAGSGAGAAPAGAPPSVSLASQAAASPGGTASGPTSGSGIRKSFTFDHVFGPEASQGHIYDSLAAPLVDQFFAGFNATILAYGQTFSGKTFTMGSSNDHRTPEPVRGIIPRIVLDVFRHIEIRDLLMPGNDQREISIRENRQGVITIAGVHEEWVATPAELLKCLERGGIERTTGDTQIHSHSSRSHAIVTITLDQIAQQAQRPEGLLARAAGDPVLLRRSKLHLVDLAGSERLKRTGAEGVRLRESVKINSGLLALGNVISVLGADRPARASETPHVPYRDSKLTRLLQDSLGGNSRTIMIACISPLEDDMDETLNTLKYAYRARKIQNKPIVNTVDQQATEMNNLQLRISELQEKLQDRSEQHAVPKLGPDSLDFDNEQWIQYFMDELKLRTIRGTNATKALQTIGKEKEELEAKLVDAEAELRAATDERQELLLRLEEAETSQARMSDVAEDARKLAVLLAEALSGASVSSADMKGAQSLIAKSSISSPAPATDDASSSATLRPLEKELHEAQKRVADLEAALAQMQEQHRMLESSHSEITLLRQINSDLKLENLTMQSEIEALRQETLMGLAPDQDVQGIVSIKILNEAASQTEPALALTNSVMPPPGTDLEFPVHISRAYPGYQEPENGGDDGAEVEAGPSVQQLTEELNVLMRAKVDLSRELSKANREAEKARHGYLDSIQRLERELDVAQRELAKAHEDQLERDQAKEKQKDEYERKLKVQETAIQKLKAKTKELERGVRDKDNSEKRLQDSQQEIEKAHAQLAAWRKKLREDAEKASEQEQRRAREVAALNREIEDDHKRIRQLEAQIELGRKKLDRKNEEIAALTRRLKDAAPTIGSVAGSVKSLRLNSLDRSAADQDRTNDETSTQFSAPDAANDVVSDADPGELLPDIPRPTLGVARDMNVSMRVKSAEIERFQAYHRITKRLREIRTKVDETEARIRDAESSLESAQGDERDQITSEIEQLRRNKTVLLRHVVELRTEKRKAEAGLPPESIAEPDAALLPLSGAGDEADYDSLVELFADDPQTIELIPRLRTASLEECRQMVVECLKRIHALQSVARDAADREQIEAQLHASTDHIAKLEQKIQRQSRVHERQLVAAEALFKAQLKELQDRIALQGRANKDGLAAGSARLFRNSTPASLNETLHNLEKDVFYYRNANKELKSKLREVVAINHRLAKGMQRQREPADPSAGPPSAAAVAAEGSGSSPPRQWSQAAE
ncbi:hypothetical protein HK105_203999 [Polyrhizophydium stewartii]|uniref:Kinesin motor domain-containing protein n=1 Tax=Polyrhizophydium stewartii TaxID=2732419 RepID=A0ABR4NAM8_9FUNG